MKNFADDYESIVKKSLRGFCGAHRTVVKLYESPLFVSRVRLNENKVSLISGGGSGHEPLHIGFVGKGMLDAACPGHLLTSPSPNQIESAIEHTNGKKGTLLIVKNYSGDKLNFALAQTGSHCGVESLIIADDIACENKSQKRGIAGTLVAEKILGAAAEKEYSIDRLLELGNRTNEQTRSIGAALSPLTLPFSSDPMFQLPIDEVEYGVGIHGEKGVLRLKNMNAESLSKRMVDDLLTGWNPKSKDLLLFINSLGATPLIEQYLFFEHVKNRLEAVGFRIKRSLVGPYVTSYNVTGISVTLSSLDSERIKLWDAPVDTPSLSW